MMEFSPPNRSAPRAPLPLSVHNDNLPPNLAPNLPPTIPQKHTRNHSSPVTQPCYTTPPTLSQTLSSSYPQYDDSVDPNTLPSSVQHLLSTLLSTITTLKTTTSNNQTNNQDLVRRLQSSDAVIKTLKSKLHIAKEESSSSSVALSTLTRNYREEKEGLMNRVAQLGSQCARLSGRDEAYQAKVRRLEGDYERLKKKVVGGVGQGREKGVKCGKFLTLSNAAIGRPGDGLSSVVMALEFRQGELLEENEVLREIVGEWEEKVEGLSEKVGVITEYVRKERERKGESGNPEGVIRVGMQTPSERLGMPMDYMMANVSGKMFERLLGLKERIEWIMRDYEGRVAKLSGVVGGEVDGELVQINEGLRGKIEALQDIITQQDDLIQAAIFEERNQTDSSRCDPEIEVEMEEARLKMREERLRLDDEWQSLNKNKMGEFVESLSAGTVHVGTPGQRRSSSSPDVVIPFEASPETHALLMGIGVKAVKAGVKPTSSDDLFA